MANVTTSGFDLLDRTLGGMARKVDVATPATLRAVGKVAVTEARRRVRVYSGGREDVPRGRLKKSIKASTAKRVATGLWQLTVAPTGYPAHAYAGQIEALEPFMEPAGHAAEAAAEPLALEQITKALAL